MLPCAVKSPPSPLLLNVSHLCSFWGKNDSTRDAVVCGNCLIPIFLSLEGIKGFGSTSCSAQGYYSLCAPRVLMSVFRGPWMVYKVYKANSKHLNSCTLWSLFFLWSDCHTFLMYLAWGIAFINL